MKHRFLFLALVLCLASCKNTTQEKTSKYVPISDLQADFPNEEKFDFDFLTTLKNVDHGIDYIQDSVIWDLEDNSDIDNLGSCYHLKTGKKISTIALRGRAANEIASFNRFIIGNDSIHFITNMNKAVKSFATADIINDVPVGERYCSYRVIPDSIFVGKITPLNNGSLLITIQPPLFDFQKEIETNEINQSSVALFSTSGIRTYQTCNAESYDLPDAKENELSTENLIKTAYAHGNCSVKDDKLAVFSVKDQFILYTMDLESGKVLNEKRYSTMKRLPDADVNGLLFETTNDQSLTVKSIKCNDKYIFCTVTGFLTKEDLEKKKYSTSLFVFDWNLKPVKRYALQVDQGKLLMDNKAETMFYITSTEGNYSFYQTDLKSLE